MLRPDPARRTPWGSPAGTMALARCLRARGAAALFLLAAAVTVPALALSGCGESSGTAHSPKSATPAPARAGGERKGASGLVASRLRAGAPESEPLSTLIALGKPIYCAAPRGSEVALTFDDGPGPYTRLVLAKLRKHDAGATFFDVGRNIDLVAGATKHERALGAVGDHTFTHPLLTAMAPAEAEREIVRTQAALTRSTGGSVFLFRPPYGARNQTIDAIVRARGMLQILWTVDSGDSLGANYAQIERNVIGGLRAGAIILMHENHGQTVRALPNIFAALLRKHLRAVTVPQLLTDDPPSAAQVQAGGGGCGIHGGAALSGG